MEIKNKCVKVESSVVQGVRLCEALEIQENSRNMMIS